MTSIVSGVRSRIAPVEHPEEKLREWLAGRRFGTLQPLEVSVHRDVDADGREAWFFVVVLPDPEEGEDTWSVDDVNLLHRQTRDKALELGLDWPWYLHLRPAHDYAAENEDAD